MIAEDSKDSNDERTAYFIFISTINTEWRPLFCAHLHLKQCSTIEYFNFLNEKCCLLFFAIFVDFLRQMLIISFQKHAMLYTSKEPGTLASEKITVISAKI